MKLLMLRDRESVGIGKALKDLLSGGGHEVQEVALNREEIQPCLGCFGCWGKTPGSCVITSDEANSIARSEVNADAVILVSKITYGGFSADIKAFLDRSIQNILPFFETYHGEMHHEMRYDRFPIWIAVGYGDVTSEERHVFVQLAERNALNMRPPKHLALTIKGDADAQTAGESILQALGVSA